MEIGEITLVFVKFGEAVGEVETDHLSEELFKLAAVGSLEYFL